VNALSVLLRCWEDRHFVEAVSLLLSASQKIEVTEVIAGRWNHNRLSDGRGNGEAVGPQQFTFCDLAIDRCRKRNRNGSNAAVAIDTVGGAEECVNLGKD
jgi:hypothetical protein